MKALLTHTRPESPHHPARKDGATINQGFVGVAPVDDFELLLCHGTACIIRIMRDLILQLSKSSIYSTKSILLSARWVDSERDDEYISWAKKWNLTLKELGGDVGYSNYSSLDGGIASGYSNEAIDLISSVGNFYDPKNLFANGHCSKILKKTFQD